MKTKPVALILLLCLTFAGLFTGCDGGADPKMRTILAEDGSGIREFTVYITSGDLASVEGKAGALERVLRAALPPCLTMTRADSANGSVQFSFQMEFETVEDLEAKLTQVAGKPVTCRLTIGGSPFCPVYAYSESSPAIDYFQWMSKAVRAAGITSYSESSYFHLNAGKSGFSTRTSDGDISSWDISTAPHYDWKVPMPVLSYKVLTQFSGSWAATRTVQITVPDSHAAIMEASATPPLDFLKTAAPEGAEVSENRQEGNVTYQVEFEAKDPQDLQVQSMKLFGQDSITVAQIKDGVPAFRERRAYSESADLTSWLGFDTLSSQICSFEVSFPGRLVAGDQVLKDKTVAQSFSGEVAVEATVQQTNTIGVVLVIAVPLLLAGGLAILFLLRRDRVIAVYRQSRVALAQIAGGVAQTAATLVRSAKGLTRKAGGQSKEFIGSAEARRSLKRYLSPAVFGLVIILFFLPFFSISCQGEKLFAVSGMKLAFGTTYQGEALDPNPFAIFALLAGVAGLVFGLTKLNRKNLLAAASAVVGFILLIALRANLSHAASEAGLDVRSEAGYPLSLLLLLGAGAYNAYDYYASSRPRPPEAQTSADNGRNAGEGDEAGLAPDLPSDATG